MKYDGKATVRRFSDLRAWQRAHELVLLVYRVTHMYPKEELFGLTSQSRRAAVSISSNIAEGFGRATKKDKVNFYSMSRTSAAELENQIAIARDLSYIPKEEHDKIFLLTEEVISLIVGLERSAVDKFSR